MFGGRPSRAVPLPLWGATLRRGWTVAVALAALVLTTGFAQQKKPGSPKPPSVGKLKTNLKDVRFKKAKAVGELKKVRKNIRVVKGTLEEVNARIGNLEVALSDTGQRLDTSKAEQLKLAGDLAVVSHELQLRTQEARARLKAMRMKGRGTIVSAIIGSKSVGDLASRKFLFERIARKDRQLFDDVSRLRNSVASKKRRQDELVREVAGLLVKQKTQQSDLKESREDQKTLLSQLRDKEGDLKKLIAQLDAEENAIEATIAAFMRDTSKTSGLTKPSGRLLMPIAGGRVGSGFGMRMHPILHYRRMHKGVDIGASSGTPIRAAADGVVISARRMNGYGNVIILAHGGGISTLYAHCSALLRSEGARVKRGETIARVGSTGLSTSPHCHFEVHVGGKAVNPRSWL